MTTIERMHISGTSNRSAAGVNNARLLKKPNKMDSSIKDLEASKEFNETYTEVPHIVSRFRDNSV